MGIMAETKLQGHPIHTIGQLPEVGSVIPAFTLVGSDLSDVTSDSLKGTRLILNIFPSLDTGTCATSVRVFNKKAAEVPDATVLCISDDLPFAQARFCGAEGIDNVTTASGFRSSFGNDFGVTMTDGPLKGLLARSVVVVDGSGTVLYTQLVSEIAKEPDYEAALAAAKKA